MWGKPYIGNLVDAKSGEEHMKQPEVRSAEHMRGPVRGGHRVSPIFIPVVDSQVKLVRRGSRQRKRMLAAIVLLCVLLVSSFTYAFILESSREHAVRLETR